MKRAILPSHHVEAVLLEGGAEDGGVGLHVLQGGVVGGLHLYGGRHLHGLGHALEQAQLHHPDVLLLPQDTHTSGTRGQTAGR